MHKGDNKDDDNDDDDNEEEEEEKKNAIKGIHVYLFFLTLKQMFILLQAYSVYVCCSTVSGIQDESYCWLHQGTLVSCYKI